MTEIEELAGKLESEGGRMAAFFAGLDGAQWDQEVYTEGGTWSIRNVLAHFVTSERGLVKLFEGIRLGGPGASEDFSIDRYNAAQQERTGALTTPELLEQYRAVRAISIAWVRGLKQEELEIEGRHPFLGRTVLREMIKMLYIHNQLHYRDIKRVTR